MADNIFLSIITGVATTVSTAVLLFLINFARNFWLEHKIKRSIAQSEPTGIKTFKNGKPVYGLAGLIISNKLKIPITIRSVVAETEEKSGSVLWYSGPSIKEDIYPSGHFSYESSCDNPYDFVTLPPFTNGRWGLDGDGYRHMHRTPQKLFCTLKVSVQYLTFLKNPKVINIKITNKSAFRDINELVEETNITLRSQ